MTVETKGYKQDGTLVCVFKRRVVVPRKSHAGPEAPSFPEPKSKESYTATPDCGSAFIATSG